MVSPGGSGTGPLGSLVCSRLQLARLFHASDTVVSSAGVLWVGDLAGFKSCCWSVRTRCWSWLERPGCGRSWPGFKVFVGQVGCLGCSRFGIVGQRCCGVAIDRDGRDRSPNRPHPHALIGPHHLGGSWQQRPCPTWLGWWQQKSFIPDFRPKCSSVKRSLVESPALVSKPLVVPLGKLC